MIFRIEHRHLWAYPIWRNTHIKKHIPVVHSCSTFQVQRVKCKEEKHAFVTSNDLTQIPWCITFISIEMAIWWCPKIGVPPNHHPFLDGISHDINHPTILGYPQFQETPKWDYIQPYWILTTIYHYFSITSQLFNHDMVHWPLLTGWWFGTFFIFPYIGNNHPNWLIFFRGVQTTNQLTIINHYQSLLKSIFSIIIDHYRPHHINHYLDDHVGYTSHQPHIPGSPGSQQLQEASMEGGTPADRRS